MIHIFTTGGSIDKAYSTVESDFVVSDPQIASILQQANVNLSITVTELLRKDSLALTDGDRSVILKAVQQSPHTQIIITHGTDTMPVTAAVLQSVLNKTIVITGAMQPAAFKVTDAVFNIGTAVAAVQLMKPGVYIVMSGLILPADRARKNHATSQYELIPS